MKHKKRKLSIRAAIVFALTLALVASMTVFFTANAAQGDDAVSHTDAVVAEGDDGTPDPDAEAALPGDSAEELETDTNPYGQPTVTVSFNRQIGDELEFWIDGSDILIDYGDNSPVFFPGDRILRGNTVRIYGDVTYLKLPYEETEQYNSEKGYYEIFTTPSGVTALDVSGAENLLILDCSNSQIKELDLSHNSYLTELYCGSNQLTELDVSSNTELQVLRCEDNKLAVLDLSSNEHLTNLWCLVNSLTKLDLPTAGHISYINCFENRLTTLDVSAQTNLKSLYCSGNLLSSLDLSNATALEELLCSYNKLSSLDLSACDKLLRLGCHHNNLTSLDLSGCEELYELTCSGNALRFSTVTISPAAHYGEHPSTRYEYVEELGDWIEIPYSELVEVDFSGQRRIALPDYVEAGQNVDLSSEAEVCGVASEFRWFDEDGNEIIPASSENGVFTFGDDCVGKSLYCVMTNTWFVNRKNCEWPDVRNFNSWEEYEAYSDKFWSTYNEQDYQTIMPSIAEFYTTKVRIVENEEQFSLPGERTLRMGHTVNLAEVLHKPASLTGKITWSSSSSKVASVNSAGLVKAVGPGTAVITVKCGSETASCSVTVEKAVVLNKYELTMTRKASAPFPTTAISGRKPSGTKNLVWKSDNPLVVSVDAKGKLTAHKAGTANITCDDENGGAVSDPCVVTVVDFFIGAEGTMIGNQAYVLRNDSIAFTLNNVSDSNIVWKTSNPKIASLGEGTVFTGVSKGTVTITAQTPDRKISDTVKLNVAEPTTSLSVKPDAVTLYAGASATVKPTLSKGSNEPVIWTSANKRIATVDAKGKITALGQGTTTVTATTLSGYAKTVTVTVHTKVVSLAWFTEGKDSTVTKELRKGITLGSTETLSFDITYPANCDDSVKWTSSNAKAVTVTPVEDGKSADVTAVGNGTAVITVQTGSGKKLTARITVVKTPATRITLNKTDVTLYEKANVSLSAKTEPRGNNDVIIWRSNNPSVATVDENGKVTAVRQGEAEITACSSVSGTVSEPTHVLVHSKIAEMVWANDAYFPENWTGEEDYIVSHSDMSISKEEKMAISVNETKNLNILIPSPWNSNDTVTWTSSDKKVATVEPDGEDNPYTNMRTGVVKGLKKGTVTITAKSGGGKKLTLKLTVVDAPAEMVIASKREVTVYEGNSATLSATKLPKASNDLILWRSFSPSNVKVDENGRITALQFDDYPVKVVAYSAIHPEIYDEIWVTVRCKATAIKFSQDSLTLEEGDYSTLTASLTPYYSNDYVTWTTSSKKIVDVSGDGAKAALSAVAPGTATITAKTGSGKSAKIKVVVTKLAAGTLKLSLWGAPENEEFLRESADQWAEEYGAAHPEYANVKVTLQTIYEDDANSTVLRNPSVAADVYGVNPSYIQSLADRQLIAPLDDEAAAYAVSTFGENAMSFASVSGTCYGFPYAANTGSVLYYDKSVYTEDEVKNLNTMLAKDLGDRVNLCIPANSWQFMTWLSTSGARVYPGNDPTINTMNSAQTVAMMKWIIQNGKAGKMTCGDTYDSMTLFTENKVAAYIDGFWVRSTLAGIYGENLGIAELPVVTVPDCCNNKHMVAFYNSCTMVVSTKTKYPEAARSLAQYLTTPEKQGTCFELNNYSIPVAVSGPAASDPLVMACLAQNQYFTPYDQFNSLDKSNYWSTVSVLAQRLFDSDVNEDDAQDMMDSIVEQMNWDLSH